ncbi:MAG: phage holin family protein [Cyanobacteria bacterium J083]|nr:MAG: phage holin family protein [Cyanobacteria bacterium J083]
MFAILVSLAVTTVSLLIISKLPLGIEIDSLKKAVVAAIVFGLLNALLHPILSLITLPLTILTFGLFSLVVNAIIFGLAAYLVQGFRLRWGFWSALLGAFALSIINSLIYNLLGTNVS